jgi:hypothetical protein
MKWECDWEEDKGGNTLFPLPDQVLLMVFPLLRIVGLGLRMIVASCLKVFDERKNPNHGFRLRTNLFLASFPSARQATHLAQVDERDGSPRDLR